MVHRECILNLFSLTRVLSLAEFSARNKKFTRKLMCFYNVCYVLPFYHPKIFSEDRKLNSPL
jgi:hypothetical protein